MGDRERDPETGLMVFRFPACLFPNVDCAPRRQRKQPVGKDMVLLICDRCTEEADAAQPPQDDPDA